MSEPSDVDVPTPSLPWRQGAPSASEVEQWARCYPDSPGWDQPTSVHGRDRAAAPVVAGAWLAFDPVGRRSGLGDHTQKIVLAAIDGVVHIRNGYSFWQPLAETSWAARAKWLPCRRDGIPVALCRRIELVDRVLALASEPPDEPDAEDLLARAGALAEVSRRVGAALDRSGTPEPWEDVLSRLDLLVLQRDAAWEELSRAYLLGVPGSAPPVHADPGKCPTYYDGCNCTVDVLVHNMDRAKRAEDALAGRPEREPMRRAAAALRRWTGSVQDEAQAYRDMLDDVRAAARLLESMSGGFGAKESEPVAGPDARRRTEAEVLSRAGPDAIERALRLRDGELDELRRRLNLPGGS